MAVCINKMSLNSNKKNSPAQLTGAIPLEQFKYVIEKRIEHYQQNHKGFCVFVLEFSLSDNSYAHKKTDFTEYIGKILHNSIKHEKDCYTLDQKNRFITFLGESNTNLAIITINKIINDINQQLNEYIELDVGIAQYPQDGLVYDEIIHAANPINSSIKRDHKLNLSINPRTNNLQNPKVPNKERLFNHLSYLVNNICSYNKFLSQHSAQVTIGAILLAKELDLPWYEIERIAVASLLHDIGYTAFPPNIFKKSEKLTPEEWVLVKAHPYIACEQILRPLQVFDDYIPIIQNHHEYIDGSGYPKGKKGDQIPLGSQIISIIDSYQAITAEMSYRKSFDFEGIVDTYIRNAGIKWEKDLITVFTAIIAEPVFRKKLTGNKNIEFEKTVF
ncbi:MAG: response regulator receiver modulated metal dependent phosphohydrolase [uncultured bacterium]|nr:MAG: response regulator receiver modulated metal dependent phosphohydrolase [uncultured bacterium]HBH17397.1 hypothetical protein [Cyanobacteria bacterium UBA9579]